MPPLLEIACFTTKSALTASLSGASRIELCANQQLGGITPLLAVFQDLKSTLSKPIPVYIMIRPHGRHFHYSGPEFLQMEQDIETFRENGADGFVFGVLTEDRKVDAERNSRLVKAAQGMPCTFHRAFDEISEEMEEQLEVVIECGFKAVLTSGGKENAVLGKEALKRMVDVAKGRIDVVLGGGVRSGNVSMLRRETGAKIFHSSAIVGTAGEDVADGEEVRLLREFIDSI
jgi:copper homeostasis protein